MPSRRIRSLHFNLKEGDNVVFHREHRSKRGRTWVSKSKRVREAHYAQKVGKKLLHKLRMRYSIK